MGNRGIYKDGWKAVVNHTFSNSYDEDVWELYHVETDYSEKYNVAEKYPKKLRELQDAFLIEATKNHVFPMLNKAFHGTKESASEPVYPSRVQAETRLEFRGVYRMYDIAESNRINLDTATYSFTAEIVRPAKDTQGVIFSSGDKFSGFTFYIKDNKLKYVYNYAKEEYYTAVSDIDVPTGEVTVRYEFVYYADQENVPRHAVVRIFINGQEAGSVNVDKLYYMKGFSSTIRGDKYTAVSPEYEVPFEFSGEIKRVVFHALPSNISSEEEIKKLMNQE
jgi:arylsulfatase